ncbi:hypothetical protein FTO74_15770 [Granulicella sp. WH15]|uniref:hypothetical protein n=1 Tax=Granulicella sp. WH15 TaxID=2602070 RepID=UPI001366ADE2|nr:hypothetical protein [Granulicella sp. WH15]QHN04658.1 hypothetical protein FTO74_15770 [Granulicella sp. WH15]
MTTKRTGNDALAPGGRHFVRFSTLRVFLGTPPACCEDPMCPGSQEREEQHRNSQVDQPAKLAAAFLLLGLPVVALHYLGSVLT